MGKKIIGIGNALMDIVVKLPDEGLIESCGLPKGSMILVDETVSAQIGQLTQDFDKILTPGGSVANTISGLANLGLPAGFIGKVGDDEMGTKYAEELLKIGAKPILFRSNTPTGLARALVTPDGERTFGTFLGAAIELSAENLTADLFAGYDIAYVEGYLVQNHELVRQALKLCKSAGLTIAIDLASFNVVKENLEFLTEVVRDYVDLIFANEDEAFAFTGLDPEGAVNELAGRCGLAVVKTGKKGSLVKAASGEMITVGPEKNFPCVDTTGAGDLYAAGFLHAYSKGRNLEVCGKAGSLVAGYVVSVYGARMEEPLWREIRNELNTVLGS